MVEINLKSTHNEKRTRDFFKFHLYKINPIKYVYFSVSLMFFIVSIVVYFLKEFGISLFFFFASICVLIVRIAATNILVNRIMKKQIPLTKDYNIFVSKEKLVYSDNINKKNYCWVDLLYIYEHKEHLFFYVSKDSALIISLDEISEVTRKDLKELINGLNIRYKKKR